MKFLIRLTKPPSSAAADAVWIRMATSVFNDVSVLRLGFLRSKVCVASCGPLAKRSNVDGERNPRPTLRSRATGSVTLYNASRLRVSEQRWRFQCGLLRYAVDSI